MIGGAGGDRSWGGSGPGARGGDVEMLLNVPHSFAVRYTAYDRCFSWKCITASGLKPSKLNWVLKRLPHRRAFTIVNMHSFLLPATKCLHVHTAVKFRNGHPYTYPHCQAFTHMQEKQRDPSPNVHILIKPPKSQWYLLLCCKASLKLSLHDGFARIV